LIQKTPSARDAERLLERFFEIHPESGPVASVDLSRGTSDIAFTVEAGDAYGAMEAAKELFLECSTAADLSTRSLDAFHVDATEKHHRVALSA
jgi:hypothetical protein